MILHDKTKHIADLARIHLSNEELEKIGKDLSKILDYVWKLNELDTKDVAPLNGGTDLMHVVRDDVKRKESEVLCAPETVAELVNAAPAKEKGYVKVKSVF